eukprot:CAMPEP_0119072078 /NCGR_PEP_ID=MMETSP1178-20130426/57599_1 /TAXON_ID=33656 /ORGANISM="unid sp, Strain CCMP2000" /LENGTH=46 /DNA_ID= /DNA_START= /DNA_END= /DNA_ORIENTATION=
MTSNKPDTAPGSDQMFVMSLSRRGVRSTAPRTTTRHSERRRKRAAG